MIDIDKHTSLLLLGIGYDRKSLILQAPGENEKVKFNNKIGRFVTKYVNCMTFF
jgi:hypothetical protein